MGYRDDRCQVVGCSNDRETVVQVEPYGLTFDFCGAHAEARVAEFDEMHYYEVED